MKKIVQKFTSSLLVFPIVVGVGGCGPDVEARVNTLESSGDKVLQSNETTTPKMTCEFKSSCSEGLYVIWRICLVEKVNGKELVSKDLNGKDICGSYRTDFNCIDGTLIQGATEWIEGYNSVTIGPNAEEVPCGWRPEGFFVYNADGKVNDSLTPETLEELGYELLPIQRL